MKITPFLWLLLIAGACAVLGVSPGIQVLVAATPQPPTPAVTPAPGVLLTLWNDRQQRHEIHLVDPATGRDLPGRTLRTISDNPLYTLPAAISSDGQRLAVVGSHGQSCEPFAGGSSCRPSADELMLVNLPAQRRVKAALPGQGWVGLFAFNSQNSTLALSYELKKNSTLMLFDANTGQLIGQRVLEFRPALVSFALDGTSLALYGAPLGPDPGIAKPGSPRLLLVEAATLAVQWEQPLERILSGSWCEETCAAPYEERLFAYWSPAVVLSHDGRQLYLVHADEEKLTAIDLAARVVRSVEMQAARSWFDELLALTAGVAQAKGAGMGGFKTAVLAADGTRLFVLSQAMEATPTPEGHWQSSTTLLGLQVIEVESGRKVASLDTRASGIRLTPDGAYLLLDGWGELEPWTEVLDAATLEEVAHLTGWEVVLSRQTDNQPVLLARRPGQTTTELAVLDPRSFNVARSWQVEGQAFWIGLP
ncbi:MAG: hypothetical protein HS126_28385 [Anaerolineales bacterium]|nr:hypothetical protein [Anaerolineales bacterium]